MSTATAERTGRGGVGVLVATALMLFSMFFGAGNLIFPPVLGAKAGTSIVPALTGFIIGGVVLPVVTIAAIAISGADVRDLARRGGRVFGVVFPVLVYLSIGAFYAMPRTGAVSFSTAISPVTGLESTGASVAFNIVFFGVALALAYNPQQLVDSLGKILTPMLVVLLVLLVVVAVTTLEGQALAPTTEYAANPVSAGLLEGYLTMDSVAALAFGIVVISALREKGVPEKRLLGGTVLAAVVAGSLLAAIYVGLGLIGVAVPDARGYADGAALLSDAALMSLGFPGQLIFGAIVLLACMTTAVGLLAASGEFFAKLVPAVSYRVWIVIFAIVSFAIASAGLETVLGIAGPIIGFIYPIAITVVAVTLITPVLRRVVAVRWGFLVAGWVVTIWSLLMLASSLGLGSDVIDPLIGWTPWQTADLGWVLPAFVGFLVGLAIDVVTQRRGAPERELVDAR